jgi:integrase
MSADEEAAIRRIFNYEKPEGKERALSLPMRDSLLLLFDLALETAMRLRECYTLTLDQIDLPRRTIFLDRTKNGDNRQVPLSSVAVKALEPYAAGARDGLLFPWWDGEATEASLRRTTSRLSRAFARIADAAGCGDLRFHDLRHEATSRLFEKTTLSEFEIAKISGHRSPRMLMRYANLRGSNLAEKLW